MHCIPVTQERLPGLLKTSVKLKMERRNLSSCRGAIASIVGRMHLSTKMHDYMDVGSRVMHGAITEEQFTDIMHRDDVQSAQVSQ